ncbi:hypothetical protein HUU53_00450 [Candidatus Micrarchaeota archaeon]|nr:hypothetical protein [Candidatus Micrarchaeota archaeon]
MANPNSERQFDRYTFRLAQLAWKSPEEIIKYDGIKTKKILEKTPHGLAGRMVLVRNYLPTMQEAEGFPRTTIIAFPHPLDFKAFENASKGTMMEGHAQENPRAIGTMVLDVRHGFLEVAEAQSHYKLSGKIKLDPYLHETYKDWKKHALKYALELAREKKIGLKIYKTKVRNGMRVPIGKEFEEEIKQLAKEEKLKITEERYYYSIK